MSASWHILSVEIRARREALGVTLRALARTIGISPSTLSLAERGGPVIGLATLWTIASELRVDDTTRARWSALAGHLPPDLEAPLLAHPERWGEVRAMLTGSPPVERDAHTALRIVAMEYLDAEAARDAAQTARAEAAVYGTPDNAREAERAHGAAVQRVVVARRALRALTSVDAIGTGR